MQLTLLSGEYSILRLSPDAQVPAWATFETRNAATADFLSVTRTRDELSIVCRSEIVDAGDSTDIQKIESGWRTYRVAGQLDFDQVGVISGLARPVAEAKIPIFCVSTFDTDYLLVKQEHRAAAEQAWRDAGYDVAAEG